MLRSICGYRFEESDAAQKNEVIGNVMFPSFKKNLITDIGIVLSTGIEKTDREIISQATSALRKEIVGHLILCDEFNYSKCSAAFMGKYLDDQGFFKGKHFTVANRHYVFANNIRDIARMDVFKDKESVTLFGRLPSHALLALRKEEINVPKIAVLSNIFPSPKTPAFNGQPFVTADNWSNSSPTREFVVHMFNKILRTNSAVCFPEEIGRASMLRVYRTEAEMYRQTVTAALKL